MIKLIREEINNALNAIKVPPGKKLDRFLQFVATIEILINIINNKICLIVDEHMEKFKVGKNYYPV